MMRGRRLTVVLATVALVAHTASAAAQRTLDIGGPPGDAIRSCYSDSMLTAALGAFNGPAAVRHYGGRDVVNAGSTVTGGFYGYGGSLRVDGTIQGDVLMLNGSLRITATGRVTGTIIVLGGTLLVDDGAKTFGTPFSCEDQLRIMESFEGKLIPRPEARQITSFASGVAFTAGSIRFTPHLGIGQYNRVEALPAEIGGNASRPVGDADTLRAQGYLILRTARDPSGSRPAVGWHSTFELRHSTGLPFTVGIEGGSSIAPTADRPLTSAESGLSALVLRRDYSDWYERRGGSLFAIARPSDELTVSASYDRSHQTTVLATDAFSILRVTEAWRPNPLIDDGTYNTFSLAATLDARDARRHPVFNVFAHVDLQRVTSNDLTPVSLPTTIRDAVPTSGYGETDGNFDLRGYLRLDPRQRVTARIEGGGHLFGDPLTIQRRRALGGSDPLPGYDFRSINCDRRRRQDPATPALCDRYMAIQVEYHHVLPIEIGTHIGGYNVGIRRPDLVLLADAGSAWLSGDSTGRVPANRIESIAEWRSDVGIGVTTGPLGFYLAKSLVDPLPVRAVLQIGIRF